MPLTLLSLLLLASPDAGVNITTPPVLTATYATTSANAISSKVVLASVPAGAVVVILGTSMVDLGNGAVSSPNLTYAQASHLFVVGNLALAVWIATAAVPLTNETVTLATAGGTVVGAVLTSLSPTPISIAFVQPSKAPLTVPVLVSVLGASSAPGGLTLALQFSNSEGGQTASVKYGAAPGSRAVVQQ